MVYSNGGKAPLVSVRFLEDRLLAGDSGDTLAKNQLELGYQLKRMQLIHHAITLSTCCALLTGVVIAALFVSDVFDLALDKFIALVLVVSMMTLITTLMPAIALSPPMLPAMVLSKRVDTAESP